MNATERIVITELTSSLKKSMDSGFERGDINDWYDFANKMKNTIKTVVPVLEKLTGDINKDES